MRFGIEKVAEKLKVVPGHVVGMPLVQGDVRLERLGHPSLFVFTGCTNVIREFETYCWQEKRRFPMNRLDNLLSVLGLEPYENAGIIPKYKDSTYLAHIEKMIDAKIDQRIEELKSKQPTEGEDTE